MPSRLAPRLDRLEAQRPPGADPLYTPPEPPPDRCGEVLRLLRNYGYLDETLRWLCTKSASCTKKGDSAPKVVESSDF